MRLALRIIGGLLGLVLAAAAVFLLVLTLAEYKPAQREALDVDAGSVKALAPGGELTVMSWNVGFGALGDNADFFMDGGTMSRTADLNRVTENLLGIREAMSELSPDVIFMQEVDADSDRSWHTDERDVLHAAFPDCAAAFAPNYKALYVPYPWPPIGHVDSGLLTLSAFGIASAERISLPCPFSWPVRLAQLKRCLLVSRVPLEGTDRELVLVNLHLEAYDDGSGKEAQTRVLAEFLREEAAKGNYVIAGGDFNQTSSLLPEAAFRVKTGLWTPGRLDANAFGEGFSLLMPDNAPTCRSLDRPLSGAERETFQYYWIDGFILSDNVELKSLRTVEKGFVCSDHDPVLLSVRLAQ